MRKFAAREIVAMIDADQKWSEIRQLVQRIDPVRGGRSGNTQLLERARLAKRRREVVQRPVRGHRKGPREIEREPTYFMTDIAYHIEKHKRQFSRRSTSTVPIITGMYLG
jgi:hypothetical protein